MWITASSNKMLQPQHVTANSKKLVWWWCATCEAPFSRRVDRHVDAKGACPQCGQRPLPLSGAASRPRQMIHCSKPQTSLGLLAENPNRIQKSVSDDGYLRSHERRILLPMLAKSFEKERQRIRPSETLHVSPKLDGIRCVVSFNAKKNKLLFFSRSGTLFECCDALIEPALRPLFLEDPLLVLDGELYNDSANQRQIQRLSKKQKTRFQWLKHSVASPRIEMTFETLTSAVRTSRPNRTPEIMQLQKHLCYHVFDVLYSSSMPHGDAKFSDRKKFLEGLFNSGGRRKTTPSVIRLVSSIRCELGDVNKRLQDCLAAGYEGVMVRRDQLHESSLPCGYAHGKRSASLLKFKVMQDDEFTIVGAAEGKGKWKGCLGSFICRVPHSNQTFTVAPAISEAEKRRIWMDDKAASFRGKALTVQFQELSSDGVPRFPVGKVVRGEASRRDWV